jgi:hypothetical protein
LQQTAETRTVGADASLCHTALEAWSGSDDAEAGPTNAKDIIAAAIER